MPAIDPRALKDMALDLAASGNVRKAIEIYEQLALAEPHEPRWILKIAESYRILGDVSRAVRTFREASVAFAREGFDLKAVAACRVAMQLRPNDPETEHLLATLTARQAERAAPALPPSSPPPRDEGDREVTPTRKEHSTLERIEITEKLPTRSPIDAPEGVVEVEIEMGVEEVSIGYEELRTSDTPGVRTSDPPGTPFALDPVRLHGLPLLGPLPSEVLSDFLQRIEYVKVAPGDRVVTQGDVADCVYLVVAGDLIVTRGAPARPIARLGEGAFFGEMALLDDAPRSASVVAVTDAELLRLPRDLVLEICDRYPHVLATLMQALRARLTTTLTNTLPIFAGIPVAERAALVERFRLRGIAAGTTVIREGQRADGLYVLLTGKADVIVRGAVIATLTTGDVAGEMSLLSHGTARATVKTRTSVTALVLPADDFQEIIMVHPQVLEQLVALSESREAALGGEPGGQEADVLDLGIGEEFELPRFEPPSVRRL